jgi:hypothetical protein
MTSERRSAWVSTTSLCSCSRSIAAASSAPSGGATRVRSRSSWAASETGATVSDATRPDPTSRSITTACSGSAAASCSPTRSWAAPSPSASASCRDATGMASCRLVPPSSTRAISAARSASSWRRRASSARARASSATVEATTATARKMPSTTQFSGLETVKRPVGGMWNQLNAAALVSDVARPSHSPQYVEASSTTSR